MKYQTKQRLIEYLYPTKELMGFMLNDIYQEILEICPKTIFINPENEIDEQRKKNFEFVKKEIVTFILKNENYKQELFKHYKHTMIAPIFLDILMGITFYLANISEDFNNMDIFNDKRSICYHTQTILDFV